MNLRQIEIFKAVMDAGTVTQAGAQLNISQPAVSKLLQLFERSTGLVLFTREKGRLAPTPEARLLYDVVERVFDNADRVRTAAQEIRSLHRGSLAVGVMPALSVGFVQEILARLKTTQPEISVTIFARETPKLMEQLVTQQIDLLLSYLPFEHPSILIEELCSTPLVCIFPKKHKLAKLDVIQCKDLASEQFAYFRHDSAFRRLIDQEFLNAKVRPKMAIETAMAPTVCAFVARGLGVSIVSPLDIGAFHSLLEVRPFLPSIKSEVHMATPKGRRISMLAEAFANESRVFCAEIQAADGVVNFGEN